MSLREKLRLLLSPYPPQKEREALRPSLFRRRPIIPLPSNDVDLLSPIERRWLVFTVMSLSAAIESSNIEPSGSETPGIEYGSSLNVAVRLCDQLSDSEYEKLGRNVMVVSVSGFHLSHSPLFMFVLWL